MSERVLFAASLDATLAAHLAVALARHREELARSGRPRPTGLVDLEALAVEIARDARGQTGTGGDSQVDAAAGSAYNGRHELLSQREAAEVLGVSPRTIRRMLDRQELAGVPVGGRRRVRRADLEALTHPANTEES